MKKVIIVLFMILLIAGCGDDSNDVKIAYMDKCKSGDSSKKMESFCECCYIQLLEYEETSPEFINAIRDNCMSLLY